MHRGLTNPYHRPLEQGASSVETGVVKARDHRALTTGGLPFRQFFQEPRDGEDLVVVPLNTDRTACRINRHDLRGSRRDRASCHADFRGH